MNINNLINLKIRLLTCFIFTTFISIYCLLAHHYIVFFMCCFSNSHSSYRPIPIDICIIQFNFFASHCTFLKLQSFVIISHPLCIVYLLLILFVCQPLLCLINPFSHTYVVFNTITLLFSFIPKKLLSIYG